MIPEYRSILNFIFGAISGIIGTTLLYPTHLIKRVFQANNKDIKIIPWIRETINTQGIKGIYKGMSVTYLKIIPYQGILFCTNEKLKYIFGYEKAYNH
jgi:solute carrier family 25 thiamine pyrophosphate transporter 19